jgi:F-type H+-transporting ATPase subunit gamma
MESFQHLKRRLKSVQNISQITKAMELVAATKMRRSQEIALNSRPYAYTALDLLAALSATEEGKELSPLLCPRHVTKTVIALVSSDKGLAGAFNGAVFRRFDKFASEHVSSESDGRFIFIAIGKKAAAHLERRGFAAAKQYVRAGDFTTVAQVTPIAECLRDGYMSGKWDRAIAFSTHFRSALRQEVLERQLLPVEPSAVRAAIRELIPETGRFSELRRASQEENSARFYTRGYLIEPSAQELIHNIASHLLLVQAYHLIMEANASEHAARRLAMKNASENAAELAQNLTISCNKLRQAAITKEIVEITAGAEALRV